MCLALREVHRDVLELPADGGLMARIGSLSPLLVLSQPMWHCTHHAVRPTHFSKAFRALQVQGDHQRPVGCREMTAHPCCLGQRELSSLGSPITDPSCPSEEGWGGSPHCSGSPGLDAASTGSRFQPLSVMGPLSQSPLPSLCLLLSTSFSAL